MVSELTCSLFFHFLCSLLLVRNNSSGDSHLKKFGDVHRLARGKNTYKTKILVSLRVFMTKREYFWLSKRFLLCSQKIVGLLVKPILF